MDIFKLKYYLELLCMAFAAVSLLYMIPMQIIFEGQPRILTILTTAFLCGVIWTTITTFHELKDKWFKK